MSVVVWDGRTLAADRQATRVSMRVTVSKIRRLDGSTLLAFVGPYDRGLQLMQWYGDGAKRDDWPKPSEEESGSRLIVVMPNGVIGSYESLPEFQPVLDPFIAWGSGCDFAMGAMAMGADARKAVEITNRFSVDCGLGVEAYDVKALELVATGD